MLGWHYRLSGHEFEQTLVGNEGQGGLACLQSMGSQRVGHNLATEQQQQLITKVQILFKFHKILC